MNNENNSTYNTTFSGLVIWNRTQVTVQGNTVELACNDGGQDCIIIASTANFTVRNKIVHNDGPGTR